MKKTVLTFVMSVMACVAMAEERYVVEQENNSDRSYKECVNGKWFVGAGAGLQYYIGDHNRQAKIKDILSPAMDVYAGRWINAVCGARLGVQGYRIKGLTNGNHFGDNPYTTGVEYIAKNGDPCEKQEFDYINAHADFMVNLTQLFKGHAAVLSVNVTPYVGLGWAGIMNKPHNNSWTVNFGIYTTYRLAEHWDVVLDVHSAVVDDSFDGDNGERKGEAILGGNIGFSYRF